MGSRGYGPVGTLMVGTVADLGGRVVAVETAQIAFAGSGLPVFQDKRLRECDYGEFNGCLIADFPLPRARYIDRPFPGGQRYRQVIDVTRDFLAELVEAWDGERVLVIAHSANRYALQVLLDGARIEDLTDAPFTWQPGWEFTLTEAAISR